MKLNIPNVLRHISQQTYLVGGSVRDLIIHIPPVDYDLSVDGNPQLVAELLAQRIGGRIVLMGGCDHTLYRVVGRDLMIDISQMKGQNIVEDLCDRDFSINAMACRLTDGTIIDPTGGLQDLLNGQLRMLHSQTFDNDPLRLLRAYRMAACLNFAIDTPTREVIRQKADRIQSAAGERIWNEMKQLLSTPGSYQQIVAMSRDGLLTSLFPELIHLRTCTQNRHHILDVFDHSLSAYAALEAILGTPQHHIPKTDASNNIITHIQKTPNETLILLKLSILLHDLGKPETRSVDAGGEVHFYKHAVRGAVIVRRITERLRMSSQQSHRVASVVRFHHDPLLLYLAYQKNKALSPFAKARFFRKCKELSPYILIHALADEMGKASHRPLDVCRTKAAGFIRGMLASYFLDIVPLQTALAQKTSRLINGRDLMRHLNLKPSPIIGRLLTDIETAYLAGEIQNPDDAIALAKRHLARIKKYNPTS